ncbi:hypothetical protein VP1G_00939 [Cytospora mali]|uniref:Gfd2/YDR514C-like C-terminal domain-containing protein n=1 Tax=Cytospora mali TaxID=578113 RepID=A0A194UPE9_CYTMA|nr:hypothetical protein VP1G_00939 [Valsa mali var. pyri (nom. inval.)]
MRRVNDKAYDVYSGRTLENERELLFALWKLSKHMTICFVSIDLEGPTEAITELGFAFQTKPDSQRAGRHIIVKSTQHTKTIPPKPCGFGFSSEEVDESNELYTILDGFFERQRRESCRVVLTGFDIKADLFKIDRDCGWKPPEDVIILDAATIFKAFSGRKSHPNQAAALTTLGFGEDPTAPFHNAVNDAWYSLELLFRKAEQAVRQIEDPTGDDTINWLKPTKTPPSSPILNTTSNLAMRLSFPWDFGRPGCAQNIRPRSCSTNRSSATSPSHQQPQATQIPSSTNETPVAPQPSRKRKRNREGQRGDPGETVNTTDTMLSATATESRPEKRPKLMRESQKDGAVTEQEQPSTRPELKAMEEEERALSDRLAMLRREIAKAREDSEETQRSKNKGEGGDGSRADL